jgi:branched-chain amino acid transport system ATP-binding protein
VSPLFGNDVQLRESLALATVYITLASNLNLMLGYAGYINFGSIVFFGLGGYICIWLVDAHHWPLAASLIATGIGVSALSLVFGFGILRLRGPFFALSTRRSVSRGPAPPRMADAIAPIDVLLSVDGLEAGYGEVQVLWGLSLQARRGKLTAIVGANGAGKTTTLRAVAGTLTPWGGRVTLDGEDVTRVPSHVKAARGLALVPEGRQLFAAMSVAENLELGAFSPRASRSYAERLEQVFKLFPRLAERARQRAGTLSGGEQQMVAIARGLMSDPQILIIDELSLGLAPVVVYQLLATLEQLRQNGLTILLVEQNVHLALAVSDYAYDVAEGRIFTEGLPAELTANPEIRRAYLGL